MRPPSLSCLRYVVESALCSRHTQPGILAVRCIDHKPPSSIVTAAYDCWVRSRARICWRDYQYVRFLVRLVQPSYGSLSFPAAIFRIVQINSLRCSVSSHPKTDPKQTQSQNSQNISPPHPRPPHFTVQPAESSSESACRNPSAGSTSGWGGRLALLRPAVRVCSKLSGGGAGLVIGWLGRWVGRPRGSRRTTNEQAHRYIAFSCAAAFLKLGAETFVPKACVYL